MTLKSINPYKNKLIQEYEEYSDQTVKELIEKTDIAFRDWRITSFRHRSGLMKNVAYLLKKNRDMYAECITLEMGKLFEEAKAEVLKCAWVCEYYAANAEKQLKSKIIKTDAASSWVQYEPLGTILGIMPWNFPFWQVFRFLAPTLMAGNAALLKHASNVQGCAIHIQDIIREAGFPKHIFNALIIGSDKVGKVIENEYIKAVTLTGSEFAGSEVASNAGKNIKKTVLELGGSNSFIVFDDANIKKAVSEGIAARFMNCGQSCIAAKRFFVHSSIAESFISEFKEKVEKLKIGNPMKANTDLAPLVSVDQAIHVENQVLESVKIGAKALLPIKRSGSVLYPVVLTQVTPGMPVYDEEIFGPVAPITIFENDMDAVNLSNKSRFGLGVTLFTNNKKRAKKLIPLFDDGAVFVNSLVKSDPRLPFGGTKKSGYGRELSQQGIREFVNVKTVYIT